MTATNQALVRPVVEHPTLRREYAPHRFFGRAADFEFLLDHMDLCSALSEQTGLLDYRAIAQPDGRLYAENKEQAAGYMELVGCSEGRRVFYMAGTQRGLFTVTGEGVVVVDYQQVSPTEFEYSGQLYVHINNGVVATLARFFFVFVKRAVDRNFRMIIAQPVDLTQLASGCPEQLREYIQTLPTDDYRLIEPFADRLAEPAH